MRLFLPFFALASKRDCQKASFEFRYFSKLNIPQDEALLVLATNSLLIQPHRQQQENAPLLLYVSCCLVYRKSSRGNKQNTVKSKNQ